jgi:hypothetical protein
MKIPNYEFNKSSFLSVEKDFSLLLTKLLENPRIWKLLYYNSKDALKREALTSEQKAKMIGKYINNVPKIPVDPEVLTYVLVNFNNFK